MVSQKTILSERTWVFVHLGIYILICALFAVINLIFTPEIIWFVYPALLWGIALFFHYWAFVTEKRGEKRSFAFALASSAVSFGLFLVLIGVLNLLVDYIDDALFHQIVTFVNDNIEIIITFAIIFLIGSLFQNLQFPFNLPAPLVNAVGAMFFITFMFRVFAFVDSQIEEPIFQNIEEGSFLIYPVVFLVVIVGGYISIFTQTVARERKERLGEEPTEEREERTWNDVGEEFREMWYDIFHSVRRWLRKEE
jgi:hypothetical protein